MLVILTLIASPVLAVLRNHKSHGNGNNHLGWHPISERPRILSSFPEGSPAPPQRPVEEASPLCTVICRRKLSRWSQICRRGVRPSAGIYMVVVLSNYDSPPTLALCDQPVLGAQTDWSLECNDSYF
jgi:hypothetical protein